MLVIIEFGKIYDIKKLFKISAEKSKNFEEFVIILLFISVCFG